MNVHDCAALQLKICIRTQQQLTAAIDAGDFNSAVVLSGMLKNLTSSYQDLQEQEKPAIGAIGAASLSGMRERLEAKVTPSIPTSYAYPDGFEGVTLKPDAWSD